MAYEKVEKNQIEQNTTAYYNVEVYAVDDDRCRFQITRYPSKAYRDAKVRDRGIRTLMPSLIFSGDLGKKLLSKNPRRAFHGFLERIRYGMGIPDAWLSQIEGDLHTVASILEGSTPHLDPGQSAEGALKETDDEEIPAEVPEAIDKSRLLVRAALR